MSVKAGFKTSEFLLYLLVTMAGIVVAIKPGSLIAQVAGVILATWAPTSYGHQRAKVKINSPIVFDVAERDSKPEKKLEDTKPLPVTED